MIGTIGAPELVLVVAALVLFFGAKRLPELAKSLGASARELRKGLTEDDDDDEDAIEGEL